MSFARLRETLPRLLLPGVIALSLALAGALSAYIYDSLLSAKSIAKLAGPQENYYWSVAQFELAVDRLERKLIRAPSLDGDAIDQIELRYDIVQSRYFLLATPSDVTAPYQGQREYLACVATLGGLLRQIDPLIATLRHNDAARSRILALLGQMRPSLQTAARLAGDAEVAHRSALYDDLIGKRRHIFAISMVLTVSLCAVGASLLMNERRRRALLAQQAAALEAEQLASRAAARAAGAKNTFIGAISHELRTPLQAIMSSVELLSMVKDDPRRLDTILNRLDRAAQQLELQMRDLTDFARLESSKLELRSSLVYPRQLATSVVDDMLARAESRGLALTCDVYADDQPVYADAGRVRQVLTNLVSNSIKYTEAGSVSVRVTKHRDPDRQSASNVATETTRDRLVIEVKDTGAGIPADALGSIFEPFTRVESGAGRSSDGHGIGLAIVKGIVDLFGGSIDVTSAVGEGSTFTVSLPVEGVALAPPQPEHDIAIPHDDGDAPSAGAVLIVDDNESMRQTFRELVEQLGYRAETAASGERALERMASRPFDLVLIDVQMPDLGGPEIARRVRCGDGPNRRTTLIAISAYAPDWLSPEQRAHFSTYLMKPVRIDLLASTLRQLQPVKAG